MSVFSSPGRVLTKLLHARSLGPFEWWHHAVVCDFVGSTGVAEAENIRSLVFDVARCGFRAVVLRPSGELFVEGCVVLRDLIGSLHRQGVKVVVRIPLDGAQLAGQASLARHDVTVERVRFAALAGADGVDLDVVDPPFGLCDSRGELNVAALFHSISLELTELNPQAIVVSQSRCQDVLRLRHYLREHSFAHVRDAFLLYASWSGDDIRARVSSMLAERDASGQVNVWQWSLLSHRVLSEEPADAPPADSDGWALEVSGDRARAMALVVLSLPGAVYVPFSLLGGRVVRSAGMWRRLWGADKDSVAEAALLRSALRLREENALGSGSFAWVDNLPWAGPDVCVFVVSGVMVVLNTSNAHVEVPDVHRCVLFSGDVSPSSSSGVLGSGGAGAFVVPPDSCAWFMPAKVQRNSVMFGD